MIAFIENKYNKDNLELTKSLFDYGKMFMHSEEHMEKLKGYFYNKNFPQYDFGNSDFISIFSKLIIQKFYTIEYKFELLEKLKE